MNAIGYCTHINGSFSIVTILGSDGSLSHDTESPKLLQTLTHQGAEKLSARELHTQRQRLLAKAKEEAAYQDEIADLQVGLLALTVGSLPDASDVLWGIEYSPNEGKPHVWLRN